MLGGEAVTKRDFQRWNAKRKTELVLEILRGDLSVAQACKRFELDEANLQSWIDTFLQTGEHSLKSEKRKRAGFDSSYIIGRKERRLSDLSPGYRIALVGPLACPLMFP